MKEREWRLDQAFGENGKEKKYLPREHCFGVRTCLNIPFPGSKKPVPDTGLICFSRLMEQTLDLGCANDGHCKSKNRRCLFRQAWKEEGRNLEGANRMPEKVGRKNSVEQQTHRS